MESIISFFGDKLPFSLVCFFILFAYSLNGVKIQDRLKIGILYIIIYALLFAGLDFSFAVVCLIATSFCFLEFFSSDKDKNEALNFMEKMVDYLYSMVFECRVLFYVVILAITFSSSYIIDRCNKNSDMWLCGYTTTIAAWTVIVNAFLFIMLLHFIVSPKFLKKQYSEILRMLKLHSVFVNYNKTDIEKFNMLLLMEDNTFMDRGMNKHTVFSNRTIFGYLRGDGLINIIKKIWERRRNLFRGYGTIDMQLIRSVGIEKGYNCKIRRKIFELCYSGVIYNSYSRKIEARSDFFKYWMLRNYVDNVRIKINDKVYAPQGGDVFKRAFGKSFERMTKEEFFIWCLGLRNFGRIGDKVLGMNDKVIVKYKLDIRKIKNLLNKFL